MYYFVTVREGDHEVAQFMVQVGLYWAGDDLNVSTFLPHLRKDIGDAAAVGKTNTSYTGAQEVSKDTTHSSRMALM